jgi:hypothetical protein
MKACLLALLVLALAPVQAADDETGWSPVQSGLQARLLISPHPQTEDWTYEVMIEFRNVFENSEGDGSELTVRYNKPNFLVTDSAGRPLPMTAPNGNELVEVLDLVLPPRGRLVFPIGSGGGAATAISGPGRMLRFSQLTQWVIPPTGGPYRLSATFSTDPSQPPKMPGLKIVVHPPSPNSPRERPYQCWRGTLNLPPIQLPQN